MQFSINMASSIDGKIATDKRGAVKLGSNFDTQRMREIRGEHDAIVMGAGTFAVHPYVLEINDKKICKKRRQRGFTHEPATVIISTKLNFPSHTPFEKYLNQDRSELPTRRIIICGNGAPQNRIRRLTKSGVEVIQLKGAQVGAKSIAGVLKKCGFKRVLLEGGGELNASFLEAKLVKKIYLTLCPILIGGRGSPTIFEGKGFSMVGAPKGRFPKFRLKECRRVKNELYLIFTR